MNHLTRVIHLEIEILWLRCMLHAVDSSGGAAISSGGNPVRVFIMFCSALAKDQYQNKCLIHPKRLRTVWWIG